MRLPFKRCLPCGEGRLWIYDACPLPHSGLSPVREEREAKRTEVRTPSRGKPRQCGALRLPQFRLLCDEYRAAHCAAIMQGIGRAAALSVSRFSGGEGVGVGGAGYLWARATVDAAGCHGVEWDESGGGTKDGEMPGKFSFRRFEVWINSEADYSTQVGGGTIVGADFTGECAARI